jgi:hypothetical protein
MPVTIERLREHWQSLVSIVRPDLRDRLSLCVGQGEHFIGIPHDPDIRTQHLLAKIVATQRSHVKSARPSRGDASFVVFKILLHHWLTDGRPVTTDWLVQTSGYSYPTVAKPIAGMGNLIERQSDRKIRLRLFPRNEFARLVAVAESVRGTVRFGDRSAQPRAPEASLRTWPSAGFWGRRTTSLGSTWSASRVWICRNMPLAADWISPSSKSSIRL